MIKTKKAGEVMTKDVLTIHPEASVIDAMKTLIANQISGLPVVDADEKMIGIITEKDLVNLVFDGHWQDTRVGDVMTKNVVAYSPGTSIDVIALEISKNRFRRVPIVEDGKVVGIISRRNILCVALELCGKL